MEKKPKLPSQKEINNSLSIVIRQIITVLNYMCEINGTTIDKVLDAAMEANQKKQDNEKKN